MRHVICYDIVDDRIRRQVVKVCEKYGQRVQYSVFEARLTKQRQIQLERDLKESMQGKESDENDSVRIYAICDNCSEKVTVIGKETALLSESITIVIG